MPQELTFRLAGFICYAFRLTTPGYFLKNNLFISSVTQPQTCSGHMKRLRRFADASSAFYGYQRFFAFPSTHPSFSTTTKRVPKDLPSRYNVKQTTSKKRSILIIYGSDT